MMKLSQREKVFVGIFAVALLWGTWNYKDMIFGGDAPAPQSRPAPSSVSTHPQPAVPSPGSRSQAGQALAPSTDSGGLQQPPAWESNPFHRSWRYSANRS